MIYQGSKAKIAKEILPIMVTEDTEVFVDLFSGGGNLLQYVDCPKIIANDINQYTIAFLKAIATTTDWIPQNSNDFTKENYKEVQANKSSYPEHFIGHVGYNLSYGGKFFGGFRHDNTGKRDYVSEAYRGTLKQAKLLRGKSITFYNTSYENVSIPPKATIYCDIPYKNTTKYHKVDFNYEYFYNWCIKKKEEGCRVFVSEYNMPEPFKVIWEKKVRMTMKLEDNSKVVTEKLFTL